jgi:anti-sigma B factor antagonist
MVATVYRGLPIWRTTLCTVVEMPEEIDMANADGIRESLLGLLNAGGTRAAPIIIDLSRTTFCDSTAINMLLRAHTRAEPLGCRLFTVVVPGGPVRKVFDVTAVSRVIPVCDDLGSAIALAALGEPVKQG